MENSRIEVLYKGALAHFEISKNLLGSYTASLSGYEGDPGSPQPPSVITLYVHGEDWLGNPGEQNLLDDIGHMIID